MDLLFNLKFEPGRMKKLLMGSQLIKSFLLLGLVVSSIESSNSELSENDYSDCSRSSSPAFITTTNYHLQYRARIPESPVQLNRSFSEDLVLNKKIKHPVYDPSIFLPLGMDEIINMNSSDATSEVGPCALENTLKPELVDKTLVKSVTALVLAFIFLMFYNIVF